MRLSTAVIVPSNTSARQRHGFGAHFHAERDLAGIALRHPEIDEDLGAVIHRGHHGLRIDEIAGVRGNESHRPCDRRRDRPLAQRQFGIAELKPRIVRRQLRRGELHVGQRTVLGQLIGAGQRRLRILCGKRGTVIGDLLARLVELGQLVPAAT